MTGVISTRKTIRALATLLAIFQLLSASPIVLSQQRTDPQDDVVKVYTELVQTDVMVFDKGGNFVKDLRPEDFELRIDGKPRPIEFFERITAGSANEETQLAAARGERKNAASAAPVPLDRGRIIFFYLDDLHLDQAATQLARRMVSQYIDREMSQNDQAAIASPSGQLGFLQQLTDNKTVLRTALEQLRPRSTTVKDIQRPPMSEYQALQVTRSDPDVMGFFIDAVLRETPGMTRESAEAIVMQRAQQIMTFSANFTRSTLSNLESLIKTSSQLPGRKLVFFISNGFFLDERNSDSYDRLRRVTSAAARNGVVIYSMDARGLVASVNDASSDAAFDVTGRLDRGSRGELLASQDALNALAEDTGGKAVFNTNALEPGLKRALRETSTYYLLAWKPDPEASRSERFRKIEVKLVRKPNLQVRVRRGFYDNEPPIEEAKKTPNPPNPQTPEATLASAITSVFPDRTLPVSLNLAYVNMPDRGDLLSISLQVPSEFLAFTPEATDKRKALVQLSGALHNAKGEVGARFNDQLTVTTAAAAVGADSEPGKRGVDVSYTFPVIVKPGLYQARVGVLDVTSGKAGSAHGWIDIPNLSAKELAMSSVMVGEREGINIANASTGANNSQADADFAGVDISVSRRFRRNAFLRFLVFVYNATVLPQSSPDMAIQIQIVRDDQPVLTTPLRKVSVEGVADLTRLPYAAEIKLDNLTLGHYMLIVTAVDRAGKRSITQQTKFQIVE